MASQDLQLHPYDTDLENTSLLILIYNFNKHQYHFVLSDARCLCYTQTHTRY